MKKINLLVIGASGGVANAFLHHLSDYRNLFDKLILLDKNNKVLKDKFIDHKILNYKFIHNKIELPKNEKDYLNLLKKEKINIVLDITDMNSIEILEATNKAGVSYINTALNDDKKTVNELLFEVYSKKDKLNKAAHILCTGMNPGAVNMWVRYGIEKFGIPREIIHFEYDTSRIAKGWHRMITWSVHEFLTESVRDPSGIAIGRGKVKQLLPNALERRTNMSPILKPIMKLDKYPFGMNVLHEENLSISYKYDIPSMFLYAINPKTMEELTKIYEKKGNVFRKDLIKCENISKILEGADNIGVVLDYLDKKVYYFNTIPNVAVIGTNATYTQVIIGIFAAIFTLIFDKIKPKTYFVEDLYNTYYKSFLFDNMRVQEFIFKKTGKNLKLINYNPMVKIKRNKHFNHLYII
ncbi:MAG: saccharopine dehydrogenase NADP-binding domain-containing protein [Nanoarchaeota archaeon]|nr:saccharopine dehydrogenase NADP-binding domain-containing protein [Nanoarchaeota archaeon]MBU1631828.1 saccharopine dehydrogenase NADP-binding domain-containing protein [Nanoarchaeota archaeon]MBU1876101.1 saccharopine dehydrogenase NADP-binding domain-containing protein [Nanoarchaeota archaeon]